MAAGFADLMSYLFRWLGGRWTGTIPDYGVLTGARDTPTWTGTRDTATWTGTRDTPIWTGTRNP